jgi:plasmid stabilization system protein ParE
MANYQLTEPAQADISELRRYIARDNRDAALRVVREIFDTLQNIAEHPEIGHQREDLTSKPVKFFSVRHYMIVYDPKSKPLRVYRVLSGYRDITSLL